MPILVLFASLLFAGDDTAARASLAGTWQESSVTWVIQEKGDTMHIAYKENGQPQIEFDCAIGGSECEAKDAGRKAKVTLWFNGPKLVQMETRGNEIVKRRFSANGDEMELEVIPISPDGKPQVMKLKRVSDSSK